MRVLLLASIAVGLMVIMGSGYWLNQHRTMNNMRRLSQETLSTLGDGLRLYVRHLMLTGQRIGGIRKELKRIQHDDANILDLRLYPAPAVARQFALAPHGQLEDAPAFQTLDSGRSTVVFKRGKAIDFTYPFRADQSCLACHHVNIGTTLGVLDITLDATKVMQHFHNAQYSMLSMTVAEALLLFLLLALLLSRFVFTPLRRLQQGAEALATGGRDVQVEDVSTDELGRVIDAFNGMSARLQETMDGLDQYIREQGAQLGNMVETSRLLGSEENLDQVLEQMAKVMTESIKVTCCRILLLGDGKQVRLHVRASHPIRPLEHPLSEHVCDLADYPLLFAVMEQGKPRLVRLDEVEAPAERDMLFFQGTKWVLCLPVIHQGERFGIVVFNEFRSLEREPMDDKRMRYAMAMTQELAVAISNIRLNDQLMAQLEEVVFAMAEAVDKKSPWTAGHSRRVADHARTIGEALGWDEGKCRDIYRAGLLHDIGKIGTPGAILNKEKKLRADEVEQLKRHPGDGGEILDRIRSLSPLVPAIRHHHEYFNGSGYPDGLVGKMIPLMARVIAVADAYDAMVSDRPYRVGLTPKEAVRRLREGAGSQFDPEIVDIFHNAIHGLDGESDVKGMATA